MGMLAIARQPDHRLCLENDLQAILAERLLYQRADQKFIIGGLQGFGKLPVHLDLLADVRHVPGLIHVRFEAAHFLVAHLRLKAVLFHQKYALL